MLLPIILLLSFFCVQNFKRAQSYGLDKITWVIYTILAFAVGTILACFVLAMIIMLKNPELLTLAQNNDHAAMNDYMVQNFAGNDLLYSALIFAGGFGGHLLIRYLIEKKKKIA